MATLSGPLDIRFAASGGSEQGLGHVMRCAAVATEARARGLRVAFSLNGDGRARQALLDELPDAVVQRWEQPGDLEGPCQWVVFDTRLEIADHIRQVRNGGSRVLVLDRSDYADQADLTILPVLHAPRPSHPRVLQGPAFCVVAATHRSLPPRPYPGARELVLVTLGGADPRGLSERSATGLDDCLAAWPDPEQRPQIHCVLGPAFRERERLEARLSARGWQVHGPLARTALADLMQRALFAVAGFGTTVYELAYLGVPMVYLTHHATDREAAERLESLGIGLLAAEGQRFDAGAFRSALSRSLLDPCWRRQSSGRGRAMVGDGEGARGILDALLPLPDP